MFDSHYNLDNRACKIENDKFKTFEISQSIKMINVKKYNDRIDVGESKILEGIKFILSHFEKQHKLFPRTIKTINTKDQVKVEYELPVQNSINKILNMFKESNYYDCKINCFPYNISDQQQQQQQQSIDINLVDVKNKTAASFIMIDLDLQYFSYNRIWKNNIIRIFFLIKRKSNFEIKLSKLIITFIN